jgi:hypothetical protein
MWRLSGVAKATRAVRLTIWRPFITVQIPCQIIDSMWCWSTNRARARHNIRKISTYHRHANVRHIPSHQQMHPPFRDEIRLPFAIFIPADQSMILTSSILVNIRRSRSYSAFGAHWYSLKTSIPCPEKAWRRSCAPVRSLTASFSLT